ncbi:dihydrodipicolinate synthase family protein, partial [Immundisolibacter sp.]|uniref:dihydrodipicolinate synthase family protein n=1 Tax=Immundisolibacter sp. TaxID=1934948 RepID=UPI003F86E4FB
MTEQLIAAGIGSIAANGTTGECAALTLEEKLAFTRTIVEVARGRVPVFAGITTLGTKETVRQMRLFRELGADGGFVGLPLWQTPTLTNSVKFYADLGEAVPDMGLMVYANPLFFKSTFPVEFWEGVGKQCPTVVTCKYVGNLLDPKNMLKDLPASMDAAPQVQFMPIDFAAPMAYDMVGDRLKAMWSTSCAMGAEPIVALQQAIDAGDKARIGEIMHDLHELPNAIPDFKEFSKYNVQVEKIRCNAAGYIKAGPIRAPYEDIPDDWRTLCEASGKAWAELCERKYR